MKKLTLLVFTVFFLSLAGVNAQQKELKVLFVGNSYTYGYNLAHIVSIISQETSTLLITRKSVIGGASLSEHWNGGRGLETKQIIAEGEFDVVVLQDFSMSGYSQSGQHFEVYETFFRVHSEPWGGTLSVQYLGPGESTTVSGRD